MVTAMAEMGMEIATTTTTTTTARITTTIGIINETTTTTITTIVMEATETTTTAGQEIQIHAHSIRMRITPTVNASSIIREDK